MKRILFLMVTMLIVVPVFGQKRQKVFETAVFVSPAIPLGPKSLLQCENLRHDWNTIIAALSSGVQACNTTNVGMPYDGDAGPFCWTSTGSVKMCKVHSGCKAPEQQLWEALRDSKNASAICSSRYELTKILSDQEKKGAASQLESAETYWKRAELVVDASRKGVKGAAKDHVGEKINNLIPEFVAGASQVAAEDMMKQAKKDDQLMMKEATKKEKAEKELASGGGGGFFGKMGSVLNGANDVAGAINRGLESGGGMPQRAPQTRQPEAQQTPNHTSSQSSGHSDIAVTNRAEDLANPHNCPYGVPDDVVDQIRQIPGRENYPYSAKKQSNGTVIGFIGVNLSLIRNRGGASAWIQELRNSLARAEAKDVHLIAPRGQLDWQNYLREERLYTAATISAIQCWAQ